MANSPQQKVLILIPVYNDWDSVGRLLMDLDALDGQQHLQVLLIDDGSSEIPQPYETILAGSDSPKHLQEVYLLPLARNLGHQRAIAIGLAFADAKLDFDVCVVMDADGEDRPQDIPQLLQAVGPGHTSAAFARRGRRSEGGLFRLFYVIYRLLFRLLTGTNIRFGNFSALPRKTVRRLVVSSELWMHYAGSIFKLRVPFTEVPADRGRRYAGHSHMNLVALIVHGLQAMAIYREIACVRIILGALAASLLLVLGIIVVVFLRVFTEMAIPGWASNVVSLFIIMIFQITTLALFFIFLVLGSRSAAEMLPVRDYVHFIENPQVLWTKTQNPD